jgi:GNAT superfamily N-acetyltransferase
MEYAVLGGPDDGPQLRLDHREFSYAGKFVMSNTGKAVAREAGDDRREARNDARTESEDEDDLTAESSNDATTESGDNTRTESEDDATTKRGNENENEDEYEDAGLVAAIAFNEDRTDPATAWLRYVTVREDRRGEGVGARLARFTTAELRAREYDRVKIAVNNPFAYQALYKAGFAYTGEQTGLAELVLVRPGERDAGRYQSGLDAYSERDDLAPEEQSFIDAKADVEPPDVVALPE